MSNTESPTPQQPTSASAWKKTSAVGAPLRVPSGNTCLVRPMDMRALVRNNLIPNELMSYVNQAMSKGKAPSESKLMEDMSMEKMLEVMDAIDDIVCYMVVEPKVHPIPHEGVARDPEILYVDEVDYEDKMFIFQYAVGGTRDVDKFREGLASTMESLEKESGLVR